MLLLDALILETYLLFSKFLRYRSVLRTNDTLIMDREYSHNIDTVFDCILLSNIIDCCRQCRFYINNTIRIVNIINV